MAAIAFIGLGNMGIGMAHRLLQAGHEVRVYNRTRSKAAEIEGAGARRFDTPREACMGVEAVFAMTADDTSSRAVWSGPDGVLAAHFAPRVAGSARAASAAHVSASADMTDSVLNYETIKLFTAEPIVQARVAESLNRTEREWVRFYRRYALNGRLTAWSLPRSSPRFLASRSSTRRVRCARAL